MINKQLPPEPFGIGWEEITISELDKYRSNNLSEAQAVSFFDGARPSWLDVCSSSIPKRNIVNVIVNYLKNSCNAQQRGLFLLIGAGGEGKSTATMQVVDEIVRQDIYKKVIWHHAPNTPLINDAYFIDTLVENDDLWLIVSDEAEQIAKDIFYIDRELRQKAKSNIHFLLCCRDTDWKSVGANKQSWTGLKTERLRGIEENDAEKIVNAWARYGEKGLGNLSGIGINEAKNKLIESARKEARSDTSEGTFLGAMLLTRKGKDLYRHVKELMEKIENRKIEGSEKTLLEAFMYVVTPHAKNKLLLTKPVLARCLEIQPVDALYDRVITALNEEVGMLVDGSEKILTRHRVIAEKSKEIWESKEADGYGKSLTPFYKNLVCQAEYSFLNRELEDREIINGWNAFPKFVFEKYDENLGIELAKALVNLGLKDAVIVVNLANFYRNSEKNKVENIQKASLLFYERYSKINEDRAYYHEWGTTERERKKYHLAVWLSGISIADGIYEKKIDDERLMSSLSGLSTSLAHLFEKTLDKAFIDACSAAVHLGFLSNPDERALENLGKSEEKCKIADAKTYKTKREALDFLVKGIILAWEDREKDNFSELSEVYDSSMKEIPPAPILSFNNYLARKLNINETSAPLSGAKIYLLKRKDTN